MGLAFGLAVASVLLTVFELDFQTKQLDLISSRDPIKRLAKNLEPFQRNDTFTVVVRAATPQRAISFLSDLVGRIEDDRSHFKDVFYRVDPGLVRPWALLYLEEKDLLRIRERLKDYPTLIEGLTENPDILSFLELVNQEMASRMVGELFTGFLKDKGEPTQDGEPRKGEPMDLSFLIRTLQGISGHLHGSPAYGSPWAAFFKEGTWDRDLEGYFWVAEKQFLLLFVTPRREKDTFIRARRSLEHLRQVIREVRVEFPDVEVGVTGQEALKTDEMTMALGDMSWATWISLAGVWLFNVLFFRSEGRTFMRMIVLAVGMCWTFGWLTLFIGHLNILSLVFAPMLVGLGDDYAIHWFARMEEEERDSGLSRTEVIMRVAGRSGPGILMAGISAALSFFPLILTGFKGLMELGLVSGVGILLQLVADFTLLPVLSLFGKGPSRKAAVGDAPGKDLLRFNRRKARWVLGAAALTCLISAWAGSQVRFDLNPLHLQAEGTESVVWEERLRENSKRSVIFASTLVSSLEELAAKSHAFKDLPTVWKTQSVLTLLPENQKEKIPVLRSMLETIPAIPAGPQEGRSPDSKAFIEILERIRFKMDDEQADKWGAQRPLVEQMAAVRGVAGEIIEALNSSSDGTKALLEYERPFQEDLVDTFDLIRQGAQAVPMGIEDLPPAVRDRFMQQGQYLIRIFPTESIWDEEPRARFVRELRGVDPQVVGDAVTLHVYTDAFRRASIVASIYAVVAIFLLLILEFRGLFFSVLALIPLLMGTLWTVGMMAAAGIRFNPANCIFLPLIVGAGVEYGIIILHRWREGRMEPGHLPLSTGKGVICAALTTTLGFGTLMVCRHQGIFSLGVLSFAGSLLVLAAAIVILPAALAGREKPPLIPVSKE